MNIEIIHRLALTEPNSVISVVCPSMLGVKTLLRVHEMVFRNGAKEFDPILFIWKYSNGSYIFFRDAEKGGAFPTNYLWTYDNIEGAVYREWEKMTKNGVFLTITPE